MTQLIENKRRRRALIATLSHFDDPTRVVVLPNRGRPSPRLGELGGSDQRESKDLLWLTSNRRCCRLEMAVSNSKQRRGAVSNRRKMATSQFPLSCSKTGPDGANQEIGVPRLRDQLDAA